MYTWLSHATRVYKDHSHMKLHYFATLLWSIRPSFKPAGIVFIDDGKIGGSMAKDSVIGTKRSSSLASMSSSSSFSECLDVIDPRILAGSERLVGTKAVARDSLG